MIISNEVKEGEVLQLTIKENEIIINRKSKTKKTIDDKK